ncbi:MAG: alanine racemase [Rhodothermaceae bacterium]|nr:MAG: alanine racemase [Rhodothermaceae bacterium]
MITEDLDIDHALAPTVAEINLAHLRHNVRLLQRRAGTARVMGVVKANAYGHGAVPVARVLREEGVHHFAVATVPEGVHLRRAGLTEPILVFGAPLPEYLPACVHHNLDVTVDSPATAEAVIRTARTVGPLRVHVEVDTGMGRTGVSPAGATAVVRRLERAPGVTVAGLYTHFATVRDAFVVEQAERFAAVVAELGGEVPAFHAASSGTLLSPPAHFPLEGAALVRMGVALYGIYEPPDDEAPALRPVMTLRSRITHLKTVPAGTSVSYDRTWRAPRRTRIATLGAGYADGYPRALSNRGEVGLHGQRFPVVGVICMDMMMVDLGPPGAVSAGVGDTVVLFGEGGPSTAEVARRAGTITYEICCGIAPRVPRRYHDAPSPPRLFPEESA